MFDESPVPRNRQGSGFVWGTRMTLHASGTRVRNSGCKRPKQIKTPKGQQEIENPGWAENKAYTMANGIFTYNDGTKENDGKKIMGIRTHSPLMYKHTRNLVNLNLDEIKKKCTCIVLN